MVTLVMSQELHYQFHLQTIWKWCQMPISDTIMLLANCDVISNATHNNYFTPIPHDSSIHRTRHSRTYFIWYSQATNNTGLFNTKVTNYSYNTLLEVKSVWQFLDICSLCSRQLKVRMLIAWSCDWEWLILFPCSIVSVHYWQGLQAFYLLQELWFKMPLPNSWWSCAQELLHISRCWNVTLTFTKPLL
jgi:hypothetical protein